MDVTVHSAAPAAATATATAADPHHTPHHSIQKSQKGKNSIPPPPPQNISLSQLYYRRAEGCPGPPHTPPYLPPTHHNTSASTTIPQSIHTTRLIPRYTTHFALLRRRARQVQERCAPESHRGFAFISTSSVTGLTQYIPLRLSGNSAPPLYKSSPPDGCHAAAAPASHLEDS